MADASSHTPVLPDETLRLLDPKPGETAVDLTVGRGGHSLLLAEAVTPGGRVIGFDVDESGLEAAAGRLAAAGLPFEPVHDHFLRVAHHLGAAGLRADVVLADLGFSSAQMDDPARGFSFTADGPLDMRFDPRGQVTTAAHLVARCSEPELVEILRRNGEEPLAAKIAAKLVRTRQREPIRSTAQLARLVQEAYGPRARKSRMHPATRTFMALRIAVNDELTALQSLMDLVCRSARGPSQARWLGPAARVAIISFQSLEDRIVKRAFAGLGRDGLADVLTKRPVTAGPDEIAANPRSRSAKLRAIRLGEPHTE